MISKASAGQYTTYGKALQAMYNDILAYVGSAPHPIDKYNTFMVRAASIYYMSTATSSTWALTKPVAVVNKTNSASSPLGIRILTISLQSSTNCTLNRFSWYTDGTSIIEDLTDQPQTDQLAMYVRRG